VDAGVGGEQRGRRNGGQDERGQRGAKRQIHSGNWNGLT
jgi:hypothetical protein